MLSNLRCGLCDEKTQNPSETGYFRLIRLSEIPFLTKTEFNLEDRDATMANRNLSSEELEIAHRLLDEIRRKLEHLAGGDLDLLFAYRRKIYKELTYLERGKPMSRRKVKIQKFDLQRGKCAECNYDLTIKYSELDRKNAGGGYTMRTPS